MAFSAKFRTIVIALVIARGVCVACTVVAVGPKASIDGATINSQTADGMFDSNITVVPGREFPEGATAAVYLGLTGQSTKPPKKVGRIPQVRRTYSYFHVGYPFMNEHQLTLAESTIAQHAKLQDTRGSKAVMTMEQLQVFALQIGDPRLVPLLHQRAGELAYFDIVERLLEDEELVGFTGLGIGLHHLNGKEALCPFLLHLLPG